MSAMTPLPIAIVAALPAACRPRKTIKLAKLLLNASPMFAARYTQNVPMYVTRLPCVSDIGPQNDGASPWTIMYTVTVKLIVDKLT